MVMKSKDDAKIMLKKLDEYISIDWNFEGFYLKAIMEGFKEIEKEGEKRCIQE